MQSQTNPSLAQQPFWSRRLARLKDHPPLAGLSEQWRELLRAVQRATRIEDLSEQQRAWIAQAEAHAGLVSVELLQDGEVIATFRLGADGAVEHDGPAWIDDVKVIEPDTLKQLHPRDGERYLRALPVTFTGMRTRARLVEGGGR
jgi:hypothetical protein